MSNSRRVQVRLRSTEGNYIYVTTKNPRTHPGRMEVRKYDPTLRRYVLFREAK